MRLKKSCYHRVPSNRASEWATACNLTTPFKKSARICSQHFSSDDYKPNGWLKTTAVPFLNFPGQRTVDVPMLLTTDICLKEEDEKGEEAMVLKKEEQKPIKDRYCILCRCKQKDEGIRYHRHQISSATSSFMNAAIHFSLFGYKSV